MKASTKAIRFLETLAASRPAHVVRVAERGVMLPTGKEQHTAPHLNAGPKTFIFAKNMAHSGYEVWCAVFGVAI
jgi:hypothetical protein